MAKIDKTSWLNFAPYIDYSGYQFWDTPDFPHLLPQDGDKFVDVDDKYVGRLDLLAFDVYGDVNLWWVIALANKIDVVPTGVKFGMRLRIPEKTYVDSLLARAAP